MYLDQFGAAVQRRCRFNQLRNFAKTIGVQCLFLQCLFLHLERERVLERVLERSQRDCLREVRAANREGNEEEAVFLAAYDAHGGFASKTLYLPAGLSDNTASYAG